MDKIFQVSEFIEIANIMLGPIGKVTVEGELTELKVSQNKWVFGTLKDPTSGDIVSVFSIVYKINNINSLTEGMQVQIVGNPSISGKNSRFSISADSITPAGEGAYKLALQKLMTKLEHEGLFDVSRKRALPQYPELVGLITAKRSEAYNDFIRIARNRFNYGRIDYLPAAVQGQKAVGEIISALDYFNSLKDTDRPEILALIRGGGSLEDLATFNDERVARAIYRSQIPVVVGVGHEGDTSIADMVADSRASTPSNAAEMCYPTRAQILEDIVNFGIYGYQTIELHRHRLSQELIEKATAIDSFAKIIHERYRRSINILISNLNRLVSDIGYLIKTKQNANQTIASYLTHGLSTFRQTIKHRLSLINELDYRQLLKRGFSITMQDETIVRSVGSINPSTPLVTILADGQVISNIESKEHDER